MMEMPDWLTWRGAALLLGTPLLAYVGRDVWNFFGRRIPLVKDKVHSEQNLQRLNRMALLKSVGLDPNLADRLHLADFSDIARRQLEAAADVDQDAIDSRHMTQSDMTAEAGRQARLADARMESLVDRLMSGDLLTESERRQFKKLQKAWEVFRKEQAEFESLNAEGGTMQPQLFNGEWARQAIQRTAEIKAIIEQKLDQRGL